MMRTLGALAAILGVVLINLILLGASVGVVVLILKATGVL